MAENTIINTTPTGFQGQVYNSDMIIDKLKVANKTGGTVTLNVQLFDGNNHVNISPLNVQLAPSTAYEDELITLKAGNYFLFTVNGSCDYYIDISEA